jgi:hypothetical protein
VSERALALWVLAALIATWLATSWFFERMYS